MNIDPEYTRLESLGFYTSHSLLLESGIPEVTLFQFQRPAGLGLYDGPLEVNALLGKRAEAYMHHYLLQSRLYRILAHQLQITGSGSTIGEIDFLIQDQQNGQLIHLELAFKLYLLDPGEKVGADNWVGPNRLDSLGKKLKKLESKQFPLIQHEAAKQALQQVGIASESIVQQLCMQGFAFVPAGYSGNLGPVNPEAIAGCWMPYSALGQSMDNDWMFTLPAKSKWLIDPMYNRDWHTWSLVYSLVVQEIESHRSPLLWILKPDGSTERMFVVWW